MTIGQWFSFRGRIGRKVFWLGYVVPLILASIVAATLDLSLGMTAYRGEDAMPGEYAQVSPISSLVGLLSIWPSLAGTIKRLHDRDRSGWWIGGYYLSSVVLVMLVAMMGAMNPGNFTAVVTPLVIGGIIMFAYFIWLLVETGFLRGTMGPNRYGPDPLGGMGPQQWQQGWAPQQPPPQQWQQPGQWQQPPQQPQWQPPPQQGWQGGPPQGYPPPQNPGAPPPGYGQPPPGYGQPPPQPGQWGGPGSSGSVPPVRRD